jgi:hypothetical protein
MATGYPAIKMRLFESKSKMEEYYVLNSSVNRQSRSKKPDSQRISPISILLQGAFLMQSQNQLTLDFSRDIKIKGLDVYLNKITEQSSMIYQEQFGRMEDLKNQTGIFKQGGLKKYDGDKTQRMGSRQSIFTPN